MADGNIKDYYEKQSAVLAGGWPAAQGSQKELWETIKAGRASEQQLVVEQKRVVAFLDQMIDLQEKPLEIFDKIAPLQESNNEQLGYLIYGALAKRMGVPIHNQDLETIKAVNSRIMQDEGVDEAVRKFVLREFVLGDFVEAMKEERLTYAIDEMDIAFNRKFTKDYKAKANSLGQLSEEIRVTLGKRRAAQRGNNQGTDESEDELSCNF